MPVKTITTPLDENTDLGFLTQFQVKMQLHVTRILSFQINIKERRKKILKKKQKTNKKTSRKKKKSIQEKKQKKQKNKKKKRFHPFVVSMRRLLWDEFKKIIRRKNFACFSA